MPNDQSRLAEVIADHQSGRLTEAEAGYRALLGERPTDPDALHFYGLLKFHRGEGVEAVRLIMQSLSHAPGNPHAWNNLGNVLFTHDKTSEAKEAWRRATTLAPSLAVTWFNLGICSRDEGAYEEAAGHFRTAIAHQSRFLRAYEMLGRMLFRCGEFAQAADVYAAWVAEDPHNPVARHMAAALSGKKVPQRADDSYVISLFDPYAASFDDHLKHLAYRAPELVSANLAPHLEPGGNTVILDAGCGTGLCGPLLRSFCGRLVGVDLSPRMIEQARRRGGYDELVVSELCALMRDRPGAFGAIVSADTLVYFGALEEVCEAAHHALRPGGLFVFTTEALLSGDAPHALLVQGRYAHSDTYLRSVLEQQGFAVLELRRESLRMERLQDVIGYLVVARRG